MVQNLCGENFGKMNIIRQYFTHITKVAIVNSPTFSSPKLSNNQFAKALPIILCYMVVLSQNLSLDMCEV